MIDLWLEAIRSSWCRMTAYPPDADRWHSGRPSIGQCAVTALVVQDYLGGEIVRGIVEGYGSHYWNRLALGEEIDLTRGQYSGEPIRDITVVDRRSFFTPGATQLRSRTRERYLALSRMVSEWLLTRHLCDQGCSGKPARPHSHSGPSEKK